MLRRYVTFVLLLRSLSDIFIVGIVWICVFPVRFNLNLFQTPKGIPDFKKHLALTLPVILLVYLACLLGGLYRPKRTQKIFFQFIEIFKVSIFSGLLVLVFFYYLQDVPYSRKLVTLFIFMLIAGLSLSHLLIMAVTQKLRKKGYNLRYYVVIGTNTNARQLVSDIEQSAWLGLKCIFFVDDDVRLIGTQLSGIPVYGPIKKLPDLINGCTVDEIYLALSGSEAQKVYPILKIIQLTGITIRIIPDWGDLVSISGATSITVGSQVLFSASDSPLSGANAILKEVFDRVAASILLIIFAIPMALIAIMIKLTSKGPVLYKQIRVGMDQIEFEILKFRTMKLQEKEEKPQWTQNDDSRRTKFGAWLRRSSLDELPQLINVLMGQMSLVGPRPEQPFFAKQFSEEYKKYMFRHKVKSGITGWAQINGFRGNTSLRKRLLYDLYYVRNWSFVFDIWILLRTPLHILKGENAY